MPVYHTGTPFPLETATVDEALEDLEFAGVLERVAAHAAGPLGAASLLSRRPSGDEQWIRAELALADEAASLERRGLGLRPDPVPELGRALARLRVEGSVLETGELWDIRMSLLAARQVAGEIRRGMESAPALEPLLPPLADKEIDRRLERAIDADGRILDTASPELAHARRSVRSARDRLIARLQSMLGSEAGENEVTVRNGRYVIPVRRDSRSRPSGIIHDESASGGTLFIEPSEAVDLGNALREAQVAEEREVLKVLRDLTTMLRPAREVLAEGHAACVRADDLAARGRYATAVNGHVPDVQESGTGLALHDARHPLLIDGTIEVVPFDLVLDEGERTVLISGPNTGGKTVLLKAVGLAAAMAQSGIIPPVGPRSTLPVFHRLFSDIGDRQSIAASLSTFSAHVATLRRVLESADDRSLVLLDEVGSGTDPAEGGALAAAVLESLNRRGTVTLASTHLGALKQLAASTPGVVNASLEFDGATLTPTYRFRKGVPGRSYGLAIAGRLGVPGDVLAAAESRVPDAERELDALLARVESRERELERREVEAADRESQLEEQSARLSAQQEAQESREAELRKREKNAERQARQEAKRYLLEAREQVEEALGAARQAADDAAARDARRKVEEAIGREAAALDALEPEAAPMSGEIGPLAVGQRVRVGGTSAGEVLEVRSDGKVAVRVGAMRMVVDAATVIPVAGQAPAAESVRTSASPELDAPSEVDLRGMTGDEAEAAALAAVDAAVLGDLPMLRIIHGMGTGVVRERVQNVLRRDRRVANFAFAPRNQGGTGVTIAEFRS